MFSGQAPASGIKSGYNLSDEAIAALQSGDVQALIDSHRTRFGGWSMKADDDDDDDDSDDDDDDDSKGKDSGDSGAGDDEDDDDDDTSGDDDDKVSKADLEALTKRMKAADKRATAAEERLRKIDDSKKDDLTKATDRVAELEESVTSKDETITSLRLENAFLMSNKHTWHKPGAALRLAQSEGYLDDVISDDGKVDSKTMEKALATLAKENDYLIKRGSGASGGDDGDGGGASGGSASGRSKNGKDDKKVEQDDRRRSPALARRGR